MTEEDFILMRAERDGALSLLADVQQECIEHRAALKGLAAAVVAMDEAARRKGLYVGAGIVPGRPDTREEQQGPHWNSLMQRAIEILRRLKT